MDHKTNQKNVLLKVVIKSEKNYSLIKWNQFKKIRQSDRLDLSQNKFRYYKFDNLKGGLDKMCVYDNKYNNNQWYKCFDCNSDIHGSYPKAVKNDKVYCLECGFRKKMITDKEYLESNGIDSEMSRAAINPNNGEIEVIFNRKYFDWERPDKNLRNSPIYSKWRNDVFERDNYTCVNCGQRGGELNAHHIKSFSDYPELRTNIDNGITLCLKCHKKVHYSNYEFDFKTESLK